MTGRLRRLSHRPIDEPDRRRAFTLTAAALVLAVAALNLMPERPPDQPAPGRGAKPTAPSAPADFAAAAQAPRNASGQPRTDERETARLRRVARRFLRGYLAYLYGRGNARAIQHSTVEVRRRLAARRPRISPATRRRHPRIVRLETRAMPADREWLVTAVIADGGIAVYPIELLINDEGGRLLVSRLSEE